MSEFCELALGRYNDLEYLKIFNDLSFTLRFVHQCSPPRRLTNCPQLQDHYKKKTLPTFADRLQLL